MIDILELIHHYFGGSKVLLKIDVEKLHNELLGLINKHSHDKNYFIKHKADFENVFSLIYSINKDKYGVDFEILRIRTFLIDKTYDVKNEALDEAFAKISDFHKQKTEIEKLEKKITDLDAESSILAKRIIKLNSELVSKDKQTISQRIENNRLLEQIEDIKNDKDIIITHFEGKILELHSVMEFKDKEHKKASLLVKQIKPLMKERDNLKSNIEKLNLEKTNIINEYTQKIKSMGKDLDESNSTIKRMNLQNMDLKKDKENLEMQYANLTKLLEENQISNIKFHPLNSIKKNNFVDITGLDKTIILYDQSLRYEEDGKFYKISVYIQEGNNKSDSSTKDTNKFHIYNCQTIQDMREKNKDFRYSITSRADNKFTHRMYGQNNELLNERQDIELFICKNCLNIYNFQYNRISRKRITSPKNFNEKNLLNEYINNELIELDDKKELMLIPTEYIYDYEYIPNKYAEDWAALSKVNKDSKSNTCEECSWSPKSKSELKYLHTHHTNFKNFDNNIKNLKVLCIDCHSKQPDHKHVKNSKDWQEFKRAFKTTT